MSLARVMCLACVGGIVAAWGDARAVGKERSPGMGGNVLVSQFLARDQAPLAAYRARRIMRAENDRFDARAQMEAITELAPDGTFAYEIVREEGSGYIRNKVLRKMLREEADVRRRGGDRRGGLTPANYVFTEEPSADEAGERRVLISPKRKDVLLVDGAIVLSPEGDLLRVEGRLAKNPSFWTRRVHVVRRYGRLGGVRVPIATESVAEVRFAGRSRFEMIYLYDSINGCPVAAQAEPANAVWRHRAIGASDGLPDGLFDHVSVP